jgi:hypothetical protein
MAIIAGSRGAAGSFFGLQQGHEEAAKEAVLGRKQVSSGDKGQVSSVGIQSWSTLLVHQWDILQRRGAERLAQEDEALPRLQDASAIVESLRKMPTSEDRLSRCGHV